MTRSSSPAHDRAREFPGMIGCFRAAPNSGPTSKSLPGPQFSFGLDLFVVFCCLLAVSYPYLGLDIKHLVYMPIGHVVIKISVPHKNFHGPSQYLYRSCKAYCPACRTTLVATRFRVAVICPIIQVPHCIRVFFYFVWFVFINHIFQFYYELCTYCNILDIYLS